MSFAFLEIAVTELHHIFHGWLSTGALAEGLLIYCLESRIPIIIGSLLHRFERTSELPSRVASYTRETEIHSIGPGLKVHLSR